MSVKKINAEDFGNEILNYKGTALVDFYADWCGPCKMLSPVIEEVSSERSDVKFVKVNVDECPEIAQIFGIMSIPTLIVFKDGSAVSQNVGYCTKDAIVKMISL